MSWYMWPTLYLLIGVVYAPVAHIDPQDGDIKLVVLAVGWGFLVSLALAVCPVFFIQQTRRSRILMQGAGK